MAEDGDTENGEPRGDENVLETQIPGIQVTTQLVDAGIDDLEAVHRRQLEWALEHAREATESSRM